MQTNCQYIFYKETCFFSKLIIDYLEGNDQLRSFYKHSANIDGIKSSIEARKIAANHRQLLVEVLRQQYQLFILTSLQQKNLDNLLLDNTFTITTAHQPNIFTGHLYFIYKILHTVKLANEMAALMPENNFVPVYYMGSEDADLDELGHINLDGEKLEWKTSQTGAVGRMVVDDELVKLIEIMAGRLGVFDHGREIIALFKDAYAVGKSIQDATLHLVNELFKDFGLLVIIPDNAALKKPFNSIVKRELTEQFSYQLVQSTSKRMEEHYKVQASGREINLFYLIDDKRERLELRNNVYEVKSLGLQWSQTDLLNEVDVHPERFSANVILRGVFQEMILPNIAFIGGGGELAYWLELKSVFEACDVPYPVLILRNSFLLTSQKQTEQLLKFKFSVKDFFKPEMHLINDYVKRETSKQLSLADELETLKNVYAHLQTLTNSVDVTLNDHVKSLESKAIKAIETLEKKMLRAEKRKFETQQLQIIKLKQHLFPNNSLQERIDNFSQFYARYGKNWLQIIYDNSQAIEAKFVVIETV